MKRKWLLLFVILLSVVVTLAACAEDESSSTNQEESDKEVSNEEGNEEEAEETDEGFVLGEEPLEITMFGNYDWYTMPQWGADVASGWIKENKKVDIQAIDSGGNAEQKLTTMIVSGELPDFIWTDRGPTVERLREGGQLVPLDPYLDKYTNLRDWFGEQGINMLRSEDGNLYQFPNWYNSEPFGNAGYVVNKGIYEELGSPPLETTDDLYEYLKLVKENYPDVIPFETDIDGQGISILYSAFAQGESPANISNIAVPNGDELTSIFTDEAYIESLKFASKLYREKLMTQDALTQDADMVREKVSSGQIAVYAGASPTDYARSGHYHLMEQEPNGGYFMIWPIHKEGLDKNEIYPGSYNMMGWNVSVITKSAEDPEKVFAFLDWLTGPEGQSSLIFGPEGEYWDGFDDNGLPQFTEKYYEDPEGLAKVEEDTVNFQWNGNSNFLDTAKAQFELTLPEDKQNWTTKWQHEITWKTQYDATSYLNIFPLPESEEGIARQRIGEIHEEARAQAIYAQSDEEIEAIMQNAEKAAQDVGYEQLLEYQTAKWQENVETLGQ